MEYQSYNDRIVIVPQAEAQLPSEQQTEDDSSCGKEKQHARHTNDLWLASGVQVCVHGLLNLTFVTRSVAEF